MCQRNEQDKPEIGPRATSALLYCLCLPCKGLLPRHVYYMRSHRAHQPKANGIVRVNPAKRLAAMYAAWCAIVSFPPSLGNCGKRREKGNER